MSDINFNSVILSTRIRLARNFKNYPFVTRIGEKDAKAVVDRVSECVLNANDEFKKSFGLLSGEELKNKGGVYLEKHLISPKLLKSEIPCGALINEDENISIMINEEDHLRIQVLREGYDIDGAYKTANLIDDLLEEKIDYAFTENYGYLTSCPTNMGTGMRASVMMHLPAVCLTGKLNELVRTVNRLGIAVRGIYGEGSEAKGHLFQFSNQLTLGLSEQDIIKKLKNIIEQIARQEVDLRYKIKNDRVTDKICRSYGILKSSYMISFDEFMEMWSYTLLGADLGIIETDRKELIGLTSKCAPYNILYAAKRNLDAPERDKTRSELLKNSKI